MYPCPLRITGARKRETEHTIATARSPLNCFALLPRCTLYNIFSICNTTKWLRLCAYALFVLEFLVLVLFTCILCIRIILIHLSLCSLHYIQICNAWMRKRIILIHFATSYIYRCSICSVSDMRILLAKTHRPLCTHTTE